MSDIIGIIGYGFVGSAIYENFIKRGITCYVYDKYKPQFATYTDILKTTICFICVPTPNHETTPYDLTALHDVLTLLESISYNGIVVIKSTVTPGTTDMLQKQYIKLNLIHNPEFLTARTAIADFDNQSHIIIGYTNPDIAGVKSLEAVARVGGLYEKHFPKATISLCKSTESESVKIMCNTFYACKVQIFTEFKLLCDKLSIDYDIVKNLMLNNGWINSMHTSVPGTDGQISYGGMCFPKDTTALLSLMNELNTPSDVLKSVVDERNLMRQK